MVNAARSLKCYYWIIIKVNKHIKCIIYSSEIVNINNYDHVHPRYSIVEVPQLSKVKKTFETTNVKCVQVVRKSTPLNFNNFNFCHGQRSEF